MNGTADILAMASNGEEVYKIDEWEDTEGEREESKVETTKKSLVHGWLEDFWAEDDSEEEGDDEDEGIDEVEEDWSGDEPDLGIFGKTKKKKKPTSNFDAVLGELTSKQEKVKKPIEVNDIKEVCIRDTEKEKSLSIITERPPSETIQFVSAADMKLPVRPPSLTSEEESGHRPKHYFIARELMTSERTYVKGLHLVEKVTRYSLSFLGYWY